MPIGKTTSLNLCAALICSFLYLFPLVSKSADPNFAGAGIKQTQIEDAADGSSDLSAELQQLSESISHLMNRQASKLRSVLYPNTIGTREAEYSNLELESLLTNIRHNLYEQISHHMDPFVVSQFVLGYMEVWNRQAQLRLLQGLPLNDAWMSRFTIQLALEDWHIIAATGFNQENKIVDVVEDNKGVVLLLNSELRKELEMQAKAQLNPEAAQFAITKQLMVDFLWNRIYSLELFQGKQTSLWKLSQDLQREFPAAKENNDRRHFAQLELASEQAFRTAIIESFAPEELNTDFADESLIRQLAKIYFPETELSPQAIESTLDYFREVENESMQESLAVYVTALGQKLHQLPKADLQAILLEMIVNTKLSRMLTAVENIEQTSAENIEAVWETVEAHSETFKQKLDDPFIESWLQSAQSYKSSTSTSKRQQYLEQLYVASQELYLLNNKQWSGVALNIKILAEALKVKFPTEDKKLNAMHEWLDLLGSKRNWQEAKQTYDQLMPKLSKNKSKMQNVGRWFGFTNTNLQTESLTLSDVPLIDEIFKHYVHFRKQSIFSEFPLLSYKYEFTSSIGIPKFFTQFWHSSETIQQQIESAIGDNLVQPASTASLHAIEDIVNKQLAYIYKDSKELLGKVLDSQSMEELVALSMNSQKLQKQLIEFPQLQDQIKLSHKNFLYGSQWTRQFENFFGKYVHTGFLSMIAIMAGKWGSKFLFPQWTAYFATIENVLSPYIKPFVFSAIGLIGIDVGMKTSKKQKLEQQFQDMFTLAAASLDESGSMVEREDLLATKLDLQSFRFEYWTTVAMDAVFFIGLPIAVPVWRYASIRYNLNKESYWLGLFEKIGFPKGKLSWSEARIQEMASLHLRSLHKDLNRLKAGLYQVRDIKLGNRIEEGISILRAEIKLVEKTKRKLLAKTRKTQKKWDQLLHQHRFDFEIMGVRPSFHSQEISQAHRGWVEKLNAGQVSEAEFRYIDKAFERVELTMKKVEILVKNSRVQKALFHKVWHSRASQSNPRQRNLEEEFDPSWDNHFEVSRTVIPLETNDGKTVEWIITKFAPNKGAN